MAATLGWILPLLHVSLSELVTVLSPFGPRMCHQLNETVVELTTRFYSQNYSCIVTRIPKEETTSNTCDSRSTTEMTCAMCTDFQEDLKEGLTCGTFGENSGFKACIIIDRNQACIISQKRGQTTGVMWPEHCSGESGKTRKMRQMQCTMISRLVRERVKRHLLPDDTGMVNKPTSSKSDLERKMADLERRIIPGDEVVVNYPANIICVGWHLPMTKKTGVNIKRGEEICDRQLYQAFQSRNKAEARKLLLRGSVNCRSKLNKYSPLAMAMIFNCGEILNLLFCLGANLEYKKPIGKTPLHFAVRSGNIKAVQLVLDMGHTCLQIGHNMSPLLYAAEYGYIEIFDFLLEAGCDPLSNNTNGQNLVHRAVIGKKLPMVKHILEMIAKNRLAGELLSKDDITLQAPCDIAARRGLKEILQCFWDANQCL